MGPLLNWNMAIVKAAGHQVLCLQFLCCFHFYATIKTVTIPLPVSNMHSTHGMQNTVQLDSQETINATVQYSAKYYDDTRLVRQTNDTKFYIN